jgi:hypothetical protein
VAIYQKPSSMGDVVLRSRTAENVRPERTAAFESRQPPSVSGASLRLLRIQVFRAAPSRVPENQPAYRFRTPRPIPDHPNRMNSSYSVSPRGSDDRLQYAHPSCPAVPLS